LAVTARESAAVVQSAQSKFRFPGELILFSKVDLLFLGWASRGARPLGQGVYPRKCPELPVLSRKLDRVPKRVLARAEHGPVESGEAAPMRERWAGRCAWSLRW
jgi:hypothetical protein